MNYEIRLLAGAQRDIVDIEAYFDEKAPHQTERCLDAIESTLDWISEYAHQQRIRRLGLRFASTQTFRYHVWYRLFEAERFVQIVAILHHRRGDDALAERMP